MNCKGDHSICEECLKSAPRGKIKRCPVCNVDIPKTVNFNKPAERRYSEVLMKVIKASNREILISSRIYIKRTDTIIRNLIKFDKSIFDKFIRFHYFAGVI